MPQSVNGFSLSPSLSLTHSHKYSACLFPLSQSHSFALQFLLLFTLGNAMRACMCVCVFLCQCASYFYEHCHFTHTHTETLLRGVHSVCNFGASILIDCQTTYGGINEEFKALLTYVNRGLCPELKFIQNCQLFREFHKHFQPEGERER